MALGGQVQKPRFFIDLIQYQYEIGNIGTISSTNWSSGEMQHSLIGLTPTKAYETPPLPDNGSNYRYLKIGFKHPIQIPDTKMFIAFLGHDYGTNDYDIAVQFYTGGTPGSAWLDTDGTTGYFDLGDIVNLGCEYDGWSMASFTPSESENISTENIGAIVIRIKGLAVGDTYKLGSIALGMIYEPQFHADLKLKQGVMMDGVKNKQTRGGHTYSIMNHIRPSNWWTGSAWELTEPVESAGFFDIPEFTPTSFSNSRMGRRTWDISFSQLTDRFYTDGVPNGVFPANNMVGTMEADTIAYLGNHYLQQDIDSFIADNFSMVTTFNYNINTDQSLYSTVYHHTLNGVLPFIFSPSSDNSPQNFAICRFKKAGFQLIQNSHKKFTTKMSILESW